MASVCRVAYLDMGGHRVAPAILCSIAALPLDRVKLATRRIRMPTGTADSDACSFCVGTFLSFSNILHDLWTFVLHMSSRSLAAPAQVTVLQSRPGDEQDYIVAARSLSLNGAGTGTRIHFITCMRVVIELFFASKLEYCSCAPSQTQAKYRLADALHASYRRLSGGTRHRHHR